MNTRYYTFKGSSLLIFFALFIYCFGLMTGSDWPHYEKSYYDQYAYTEWGYNLYATLSFKLGVNFLLFRSFSKLICMLIVLSILDKLSGYSFFAKTLFFCTFALMIFVSDPFRAMFAVTIISVAIYFRINHKIKESLLMCVLACSFHFSALAVVPFIYLKPIQCSTKKLILVIILVLALFSSFDFLFYTFITFANLFPFLESKVSTYESFLNYSEGTVAEIKTLSFTFGSLLRLFSLFFLLKYRDNIVQVKYGPYIFLYGIVYLLLYRLGLTFSVLARLGYYFMIFYFLSFSIVIDKFFISYKRLILLIIVAGAFSLNAYTILTTSYEFLPYSNLWEYILKGYIPTYEYRKTYNPDRSLYMNDYQKMNDY